MGVSVFLYKFDDFKKANYLELKYLKFKDLLWKEVDDFDACSLKQIAKLKAKEAEFAKNLGLNEHGKSHLKTEVSKPHPKYPNHPFQIGYFGSSSNLESINTLLLTLESTSLAKIFERKKSDLWLKPNWKKVYNKINSTINNFKKNNISQDYLIILEIIKSTCEFVISQDDCDKYYLFWNE
jgi:hypothetical protein